MEAHKGLSVVNQSVHSNISSHSTSNSMLNRKIQIWRSTSSTLLKAAAPCIYAPTFSISSAVAIAGVADNIYRYGSKAPPSTPTVESHR